MFSYAFDSSLIDRQNQFQRGIRMERNMVC